MKYIFNLSFCSPPLPPCSTAGSRDLTLRPLLSFHGTRNKENFQSRNKSNRSCKTHIDRTTHWSFSMQSVASENCSLLNYLSNAKNQLRDGAKHIPVLTLHPYNHLCTERGSNSVKMEFLRHWPSVLWITLQMQILRTLIIQKKKNNMNARFKI